MFIKSVLYAAHRFIHYNNLVHHAFEFTADLKKRHEELKIITQVVSCVTLTKQEAQLLL